jgi:hypothetical protein
MKEAYREEPHSSCKTFENRGRRDLKEEKNSIYHLQDP